MLGKNINCETSHWSIAKATINGIAHFGGTDKKYVDR
jgi:hypothetical protein